MLIEKRHVNIINRASVVLVLLTSISCRHAYVPRTDGIQSPEQAKEIILKYERHLFQRKASRGLGNMTPQSFTVNDDYFLDFVLMKTESYWSYSGPNIVTTTRSYYGIRPIYFKDIASVRVEAYIPGMIIIPLLFFGIIGPPAVWDTKIELKPDVPARQTGLGTMAAWEGGDITPLWIFDISAKRKLRVKFAAAVLYMAQRVNSQNLRE